MMTARGCLAVYVECADRRGSSVISQMLWGSFSSRYFGCNYLLLVIALALLLSQPNTLSPAFPQEPNKQAADNTAQPATEDAISANALANDDRVAAEKSMPPLHERIDTFLGSSDSLLIAARAPDGETLRRLSLDLRGVVPTREELDAFIADASAERWQTWVRRFLDDPLCDEHLVQFLDRTLMLRRAHSLVDRTSWIAYLRDQVTNNTPLDELSRQLLYAPWWNQEQRVSQKFLLDRGGDPNLIARDLGRVFLGQDLQCAQCHDHPIIDDYKQTDYHGLVAFFSPSKLAEATFKDAEDKEQKVQLYVESPAGDATFESVFNTGVPYRSGPRLPGSTEQFEDYALPDQRLLAAPPADAIGGIPTPPKHSRREMLAEQLANRNNHAFVSNWANRLWAFTFGQGLVHPVDMQHADNPPIHPAVFALITDGLVDLNMQPRPFIEQLVLTEAYRRSDISLAQATALGKSAEATSIRAAAEAKRTAIAGTQDQLSKDDYAAQKQYEAAEEVWSDIQAGRAAIRTELDAAEASLLAEQKKFDEASVALAAAEKRSTDALTRIQLLDEAAAKLQQAVDLGGEDPELKNAVDLSKQRAEALRTSTPELEKTAAEAKATVDSVALTLAQAKEKTQEVVARLEPVQQSLLDADTATLAAREQWNRVHISKLDAERELTYAENTIAWLDSLQAVESIHSDIDQLSQKIQAMEQQVAANSVQVADAQSQHAAATRTLADNIEVLTASKAAIERNEHEIDQLRQSVAALEQATKLISAPETLNAAQTTISAELENRRTKTGQLASEMVTAQRLVDDASALATQQKLGWESLQKEAEQLDQQIAMAREQRTLKQSELDAANTLTEESWTLVSHQCSLRLDTAGLYALTPEQLCWSTLRITGQLDAYIRAERAELDKQNPLAEDADNATKIARQRQAVRQAFDKLRGNADVFVSLYASGPDKTQDDYFASADQALFVANAGSVFAWAGPGNNNVTQQAIAKTDDAQIAETLYWSLLCRQPTSEETQLVAEQLAAAGDARNTVIQEMVWGILASAEFRFCH